MFNKGEVYVQRKTQVVSFMGMEGALMGIGDVEGLLGWLAKFYFCVSHGGYKGIYIAMTY